MSYNGNIFELEHYTFTYPNQARPALNDLTLSIRQGEFVLLCGVSGCGKTTLLRQLKPALSPYGNHNGQLRFGGKPLSEWDLYSQTSQIGYVMQSPDAQLVTDKVWHELAFGLESLGLSTSSIRLRTAEMASFFGIEDWFDRDVSSLSGGQKQLLNLASVMAMQPQVLLLDEPTSQLDPIASADFLASVKKINTELGVAVILVEQRLQDVFPLADRVMVLDGGKLLFDAPPAAAAARLAEGNHPMAEALPAPAKISREVTGGDFLPLTVREGRQWIGSLFSEGAPKINSIDEPAPPKRQELAVSLKDCWFAYEKNGRDIIKDLTIQIPKGGLYCILGGNGTGKSTALNLIAEILHPYRGKRHVNGRTAMLPQNPQSLFVMETVQDDLLEVLEQSLSSGEKQEQIVEMAKLVDIMSLLDRHPFDLSGGEQQRAALGKVLLTHPDILLLDEPTKGLDAFFKLTFAGIVKKLIASGVTVIMVSHDIEFCAEYADSCALFFNGNVVTSGSAHSFFAGNNFYTTAANRMTRGWFQNTVTNEDVIALCRKNQK